MKNDKATQAPSKEEPMAECKRLDERRQRRWEHCIDTAVGEVYRGLSAKGMRDIATRSEKRGADMEAQAYRQMADQADRAPKHNGEYCRTWVIYGVCPPWPHD